MGDLNRTIHTRHLCASIIACNCYYYCVRCRHYYSNRILFLFLDDSIVFYFVYRAKGFMR